MTVKFNKDTGLGVSHEVPCTRCACKTEHKVVTDYQLRGDEDDGNWSFSWIEDHQVIQCQGCKALSFRLAKCNSEGSHYTDPDTGEVEYDEDVSFFPPRIEGYKALDVEDSVLLPTQLKRVYDETIKALMNQSPVLAGVGLRALVETVCKDKKAAGYNLQAKIDDLVKLAVLTPGDAGILHKVRALGNDAAHEAKPHTEAQLRFALSIVEHMLRSVYIFPHKAEFEFPKDPPP